MRLLTTLFMADAQKKPLKKNCKTWKIIKPRSMRNSYLKGEQLAQSGYSRSSTILIMQLLGSKQD